MFLKNPNFFGNYWVTSSKIWRFLKNVAFSEYMNFTRLFDEILKVDTLIQWSRAVCSVCQGMSGSWLKQILRYLPLEEPKSNKLFDTSSKQVSTCNLSYVTCLVIFGLWKITAWLVYVSCCWAIRQYFSGCGVLYFGIYWYWPILTNLNDLQNVGEIILLQ